MVAVDGTISDVKIKMVVANTLTDSTANFSLGTPRPTPKSGYSRSRMASTSTVICRTICPSAPGSTTAADFDDGIAPVLHSATLGNLTKRRGWSGARLTSLCLFGCKARVTSSVKPASFDITRSVAV